MRALYFDQFGSSSVLKYGEIPDPVSSEGQALVRVSYAGLNFADIYRRRGQYHLDGAPPYIDGYEAAGIVAQGDSKLVGKPVLFVDAPRSNAELVAVPVDKLILLPDSVDLKLAATVGLQGLTADFLSHDLGRNTPGDQVFITGVSGGVGQLLAQILVADGMEVYGSTSTPEKASRALELGVHQVLPSRDLSWVAEWTSRFDTVYDGLGTTLNDSIVLTKNRGSVVMFGLAAGEPPQVDFTDLIGHSKNILTGDLWDFLTTADERRRRAERLFGYLLRGQVTPANPTVFPLSKGQAAHDLLESGHSTGKIILQA
ncbi:MAG: zinc-binding dehydrogenase [Propionibacteriaceae bacterium]|nr:zinc-binding dehydrogenase [Propionibacteriaceae bacterium]